jgi:hypothetical protein
MTAIDIVPMVKCPMLYDHEPCDLIPATDCRTCKYRRKVFTRVVDCKWGDC